MTRNKKEIYIQILNFSKDVLQYLCLVPQYAKLVFI